MKAKVVWKNSMVFEGEADGQRLEMDAKAPVGRGSAPTPKELVALGLGGCTAMDVIALLKKYRQMPSSFEVGLEISTTASGHPAVFEAAGLTYSVTGEVEPARLLEAVQLSQTKYCGVSAMLAKAFPIQYRVILNGAEIGQGSASFQSNGGSVHEHE